jgi:Flp pilus assembly protein TadD
MRHLPAEAMQAWLAGDHMRAEDLARAALSAQPDDPNALQVLGAACLRDGRLGEAVQHLRAADRATPGNAIILNTLGVALRQAGHIDEARRAYRRAGNLGSADAQRNLGSLELAENNIDAAIVAFQAALASEPNALAAHAGLAHLYELRHDLALARAHAEEALRLEPKNELGRLALGRVLLRERDWAGVETLLAPLGRDTGAAPVNRAIAIGLVGDALDRAGRTEEAFEAFTAANTLLRQLHANALAAENSPFHPATVARLTRFIAAEDVGAWAHPEAAREPPVFLVGFPRSGTTLLDQILSSHSRVLCLEEKEILAPVVADLLPDDVLIGWRTLPHSTIGARRRLYWQKAETAAGAPLDGCILIDKLPLNLVLLPAIARIFPDAKVIVALRDPRDAVLSCYQQRFGMNAAMVQMLELGGAVRYYDAAMRLFEICETKLPLRFQPVRYEDVVSDIERAARTLAGFLDLAFEPAMLDYAATARRRDINTPSARQVIEPLYTRSIGRWRAYAPQLAPALPVLSRWAARLGYRP